jgi:YHS domain-containing protein
MTATKMLDPVCDMIVDLAEARDQGLTLELPDREYAFCGQGCQTKFAKSPETYKAKVDAWLAAEPREEQVQGHAHADELPTIDAGMREWYKACRCCMHDAYPAVVEQLDAERAATAQAPSSAGICETAEAQQPSSL